jgi:hypothetical protein
MLRLIEGIEGFNLRCCIREEEGMTLIECVTINDIEGVLDE